MALMIAVHRSRLVTGMRYYNKKLIFGIITAHDIRKHPLLSRFDNTAKIFHQDEIVLGPGSKTQVRLDGCGGESVAYETQ